MDDLLSKLRSQVSQKTETAIHTQKESTSFIKIGEGEAKEIFEINTSESEELSNHRFKLDFDNLKKTRTGNFVTVNHVKDSEENRINGTMWGIIKSIEMFKGISCSVYRWEICDETGCIHGSSLIDDKEVTVGNIVCLENFALWKIESNHVNIVRRNLKRVIK